MNGKIKTVNSEKGFGFIKGVDGKEYFFHRSAMMKNSRFEDLRRDVAVEFTDAEGDRGPRAEDVSLA